MQGRRGWDAPRLASLDAYCFVHKIIGALCRALEQYCVRSLEIAAINRVFLFECCPEPPSKYGS